MSKVTQVGSGKDRVEIQDIHSSTFPSDCLHINDSGCICGKLSHCPSFALKHPPYPGGQGVTCDLTSRLFLFFCPPPSLTEFLSCHILRQPERPTNIVHHLLATRPNALFSNLLTVISGKLLNHMCLSFHILPGRIILVPTF